GAAGGGGGHVLGDAAGPRRQGTADVVAVPGDPVTDRPPERWILALDVPHDRAPPAVTMRRLIKHLGRAWHIRCKGYSEDRRVYRLVCEIERVQGVGRSFGARR